MFWCFSCFVWSSVLDMVSACLLDQVTQTWFLLAYEMSVQLLCHPLMQLMTPLTNTQTNYVFGGLMMCLLGIYIFILCSQALISSSFQSWCVGGKQVFSCLNSSDESPCMVRRNKSALNLSKQGLFPSWILLVSTHVTFWNVANTKSHLSSLSFNYVSIKKAWWNKVRISTWITVTSLLISNNECSRITANHLDKLVFSFLLKEKQLS